MSKPAGCSGYVFHWVVCLLLKHTTDDPGVGLKVGTADCVQYRSIWLMRHHPFWARAFVRNVEFEVSTSAVARTMACAVRAVSANVPRVTLAPSALGMLTSASNDVGDSAM